MPLAVPAATLGAGIIGGAASNSAAKKSANAVQAANAQSLALQQQMYDQTRSDLQPYTQGGYGALDALQRQLGLAGSGQAGAPNALKTDSAPGNFSYGLEDYTASPAYQFQLDQGIKSIEASQAARGALGSGATLKALQKYGQNLAYQDFGNERTYAAGRADTDRAQYDNDRNYLTGGLFNLANLGQNAAAGTASAGRDYANSASDLFGSNAAAQSAAYGGQAQAINSVLGSGQKALDQYNQYNALKPQTPTAPSAQVYKI